MSENGISNFSAVSSIIVSTLGSGITLMPAVYNTFGNQNATLLMAFTGIISFISLYSIAYSAKMTQNQEEKGIKEGKRTGEEKDIAENNLKETHSKFTYEGIAASFSPKLKFAVALTLCVSSLSTAFSFVQILLTLIFQSLRFNPSFNDIVGSDKTWTYFGLKMSLLVVMAVIYFPLFKLDSLSSLDVFSKLSLFCAILFSVVTFGYGVLSPIDESVLAKPSEAIEKMSMGAAMGSVIFALHCQFSFPDILSAMKNQSLSNFRNITMIATVLATLLYSAVGFCGFRGLGSFVGKQTLVMSFGKSDSALAQSLLERFGNNFGLYLPRAIQTAYIPIFFTGILFNVFSIIPILQNIVKVKGKPASRNVIASLLSIFVVLSGLKEFDDLGKIFGIIGFLFVTPLSFLYPALFVILSSKKFTLFKAASYAMVLLSIVIMVGLFINTFDLLDRA